MLSRKEIEERLATNIEYNEFLALETAKELVECLEGMCWQFGYRKEDENRLPISVWTGGMSNLEWAFEVLGWDDPHLVEAKP